MQWAAIKQSAKHGEILTMKRKTSFFLFYNCEREGRIHLGHSWSHREVPELELSGDTARELRSSLGSRPVDSPLVATVTNVSKAGRSLWTHIASHIRSESIASHMWASLRGLGVTISIILLQGFRKLVPVGITELTSCPSCSLGSLFLLKGKESSSRDESGCKPSGSLWMQARQVQFGWLDGRSMLTLCWHALKNVGPAAVSCSG